MQYQKGLALTPTLCQHIAEPAAPALCNSATREGYTKLLSLEELQSTLHSTAPEVTINSYTYLGGKAP